MPRRHLKPLLTSILCTIAILSFGQKDTSIGPNFDIADFNKKFAVAEWLCNYDLVAWRTSDSVMAQDKNEINRLGKEWFCYEDRQHTWHALYGKYVNGSFDMVFHFTVDSIGKVKLVRNKVDTSLTNSYARALITANSQMADIRDTIKVQFNQYIRQNEDKTFTVWILPAFQPSNTAVYGGEFIYTISQSGEKLIKDDSYFQGNFRGFKVDKPREIWLNYRETDKPTLGAVLFVWY